MGIIEIGGRRPSGAVTFSSSLKFEGESRSTNTRSGLPLI